MPNWVYNRVYGSNKVCKALLNKKGFPTFKNLVPTPRELLVLNNINDTSLFVALSKSLFDEDDSELREIYTHRAIKEPYDEWRTNITRDYSLDQLLARKNLQDKYGVSGWYDFNCRYYGCKWDASSEVDFPEDATEIEFETPWSPPEAIMDMLADKFPNEEFTWHADEESCAFSFDRVYHGDGTWSEMDVPAEYYTPYIAEESDLLEQLGDDYSTDPSILRQSIKNILPDGCNMDFQEDKDAGTLSVTVYDWDQYGGDELYTHVFEGVQYK